MGDLDDFSPAIAYLSDFCCLLLDLPGHGRTQVTDYLMPVGYPIPCGDSALNGRSLLTKFTQRGEPPQRNFALLSLLVSEDRCYQMPVVAEAIVKLLQQLAIADCLLAGYSMGGRLALYLAVHYPQYFRGVILESASPGLKTQPERDRRIARDLELAQRLETEDFAQFISQWYANPLFKSFTRHPNYQQAIAKRLNNNPLQLAKSLRFMGLGMQPSLWNSLPSISLPILLIVGELDHKFVAINHEIVELCPQAELKIIKQTGHNIHFERPQQFARAIALFQARL